MDVHLIQEVRQKTDDEMHVTVTVMPDNVVQAVYGVTVDVLAAASDMAVVASVPVGQALTASLDMFSQTVSAGATFLQRPIGDAAAQVSDTVTTANQWVCHAFKKFVTFFDYGVLGCQLFYKRVSSLVDTPVPPGGEGRQVPWNGVLYYEYPSPPPGVNFPRLWDSYRNSLYQYQRWLPVWAYPIHVVGQINGGYPEIDLSSFEVVDEGPESFLYFKTPFITSPSYDGVCLASHPDHLLFEWGLTNGAGFRHEWVDLIVDPSAYEQTLYLPSTLPVGGNTLPAVLGIGLSLLMGGASLFGVRLVDDDDKR